MNRMDRLWILLELLVVISMGSCQQWTIGQLVEGTRGLEELRVCPSQMAFGHAHSPIVEMCGVLGQGSSRMLLGGAHHQERPRFPWRAATSSQKPHSHIGELYLADFVAETLETRRASRTLQGGPLTDEEKFLGPTHLSGVAACCLWT